MSFLKESKMENRKVTIEDHIGIYDGFILPSDCEKAIEIFKQGTKFNKTYNRMQSERMPTHLKHDVATDLNYTNLTLWQDELKTLLINFDMALKMYETHTSIKEYLCINNFKYTGLKIQKTLPGQGYHVWHTEQAPVADNMRRALAYSVYLNDIEDGGETEFLNQAVRVKPKTGRIAIWPAGFPYVHRGNPPLKGEKYILTSWLLVPETN